MAEGRQCVKQPATMGDHSNARFWPGHEPMQEVDASLCDVSLRLATIKATAIVLMAIEVRPHGVFFTVNLGEVYSWELLFCLL